jgi:type IV pilus assembly protein PilV
MRVFHSRQPEGASLIEILIALVVISIGMLGSAVLQVMQLRQITQANTDYTIGFQVIEIMDSMAANPAGVTLGHYKTLNFSALSSKTEIPCNPPNGCSPGDIATNDAIRWAKGIAASLPNGTLSLTHKAGTTYTITLRWSKEGKMQTYTQDITL